MKTSDDVTAWIAPDGVITTLEVDAIRSVANALMALAPKDREGQMIRGYLLGLAGDEDMNIAQLIHAGRLIRKKAGDAPLIATFDVVDAPGGAASGGQAVPPGERP